MSSYNVISLPAIKPTSMTWGLMRFDGQFVSPLNGTIQSIRRGARWTCDLTWQNLTSADLQELGAFFSQLSDKANMVLLPNYGYKQRGTLSGSPDYYRKAGDMDVAWISSHAYSTTDVRLDTNGNVQSVITSGTSGTAEPTWNTTVGGSTSDGSVTWDNLGAWSLGTLVGIGAVAGATGILLSGDMIQLATNQLVQVTDAGVSANASGHFLAHVAPDIRSEPPHVSALVLTNPSCYMQLKSQGYSMSIHSPILGDLSVSFMEIIT